MKKKYDTATTSHRRAECHNDVPEEHKANLANTYTGTNPAPIQRQTHALTEPSRV